MKVKKTELVLGFVGKIDCLQLLIYYIWKQFIILLFVGKRPTNWLQVLVFEQLQGNLHCGPYQSAKQVYLQLIPNPTHSKCSRSSRPSIKTQPLKTTLKRKILHIRNTYLYIPHYFFEILILILIGRTLNRYISLPIIIFCKNLKAKS